MNCTASDALSGLSGLSYGQQTANGDGTYNLSCTASDLAGNTAGGSATVQIDGTPPVVSGSLSGGTMGKEGWYLNGPVSLRCTVTDATSGVAAITYGVPTATEDGATNLNCTARDNAGNTAGYSTDVLIDTIPPSAELIFSGNYCAGGWYNSPVRINLQVSDAQSGPAGGTYQLDGKDWSSDKEVTDGIYSVTASASDLAGNGTHTGDTLQVDTMPPQSQWKLANGAWVGGKVTLSGTSVDLLSGIAKVFVSLDGGKTWASIGRDSIWTYKWDTGAVPDGAYSLWARADDNACNHENTAKIVVNVDNTPPELVLQDTFVLMGRSTAFFASDAGSGVDRERVTISGNGINPRVMDFFSSGGREELAWDGRDGDGNIAPWGTYDMLVEVWDKVGNYTRTKGTWMRPQPAAPIDLVNADQLSAVNNPGVPASTINSTAHPTAGRIAWVVPLWVLGLPALGICAWLAASGTALARDRRWRELRAIGHAVTRYRAQSKTNFGGGENND